MCSKPQSGHPSPNPTNLSFIQIIPLLGDHSINGSPHIQIYNYTNVYKYIQIYRYTNVQICRSHLQSFIQIIPLLGDHSINGSSHIKYTNIRMYKYTSIDIYSYTNVQLCRSNIQSFIHLKHTKFYTDPPGR